MKEERKDGKKSGKEKEEKVKLKVKLISLYMFALRTGQCKWSVLEQWFLILCVDHLKSLKIERHSTGLQPRPIDSEFQDVAEIVCILKPLLMIDSIAQSRLRTDIFQSRIY